MSMAVNLTRTPRPPFPYLRWLVNFVLFAGILAVSVAVGTLATSDTHEEIRDAAHTAAVTTPVTGHVDLVFEHEVAALMGPGSVSLYTLNATVNGKKVITRVSGEDFTLDTSDHTLWYNADTKKLTLDRPVTLRSSEASGTGILAACVTFLVLGSVVGLTVAYQRSKRPR